MILISIVLFIGIYIWTRAKTFSLFFFLPATFFHELAHFTISFFTLGRPKKISLLPRRSEKGWVLGYVESHNLNWINGSLITLAPLLLLPLAFFYLELSASEENLLFIFLKGYVIANLILGMTPSPTDFKIAFKHPLMIFVGVGVGVYFWREILDYFLVYDFGWLFLDLKWIPTVVF